MIQLNYNQKLIGLSLLKTTGIDGAVAAFSDTISGSWADARELLNHLRRTHVLCSLGMLEKNGENFFLYLPSDKTPVVLDDYYFSNCSYSQFDSLSRAMQFLEEQRN